MAAAMNTAPIKWAQRSDALYLTIDLPDVCDETIILKDEELSFTGKSNGKQYEMKITFFKPVDAEESTYKVHPRNIQMHILKKKNDGDEGFWPRLLKDKSLEKNQVTIDWNRYVDDDDEGEAGNFDLSNLQGGRNFGGGAGMPGMGGMDLGNMDDFMKQMGSMNMPNEEGSGDIDSDDEDLEDLPELEKD
jgi:prostaglandin-E synthase